MPYFIEPVLLENGKILINPRVLRYTDWLPFRGLTDRFGLQKYSVVDLRIFQLIGEKHE